MKKLIVLMALLFSFAPQDAEAWGSIKDEIYKAAKAGDTRTIESYLKQGYSIDEKDANGNTALCTASWDYSPYAYDLLRSYGANPKADCMRHTEDKVAPAKTDYDGYLVGGGIALVVGTAAILAGGSGGGDNPGPGPEPEKNTFKNDREFNATNFSSAGATNFLASINADGAFSRFYTIEDDGNITTTLSGTSAVGIVDTGVDGGHSEFNRNGGSKVSGYNFDYGPCFGEDHTNCWKSEEYPTYDKLVFYDSEGIKTELAYYVEHDAYLAWKAAYPENYDWDEYKNRADSFYPITSIPEDPLNEGSYAHGTHIAGIIGANHDQTGMMGVAFTNTDIRAVRWDFMSSLYEPIKALVDDNVVAINLSIGSTADEDSSSYDYGSPFLDMMTGWKEAAAYTMSTYDYSDNYKDGTIWVKAAGNDSYRFPDLESGIKLIETYSNLMMVVVVSADVSLNDDGTINTYSLSDYSNKCGNTSGYCIAAPGNFIASTNIGSGYIGMSGTSMATPMVTGAIAFLKNAFPNMRSEQIIDLLMSTANKSAEDYDSSTYGAGLLDITAALEYQSPVSGSSEVVTVTGNSLSSSYVRLDNASLVVAAPMAQTLQKALPAKITAFDAYGRAYDYPTANYIRSSHSGYKNLKNDVAHIIPLNKKHEEWKDNIHFAYTSGGTYNKPLNYMMSEYKHGRHTSGFYFSENSKYQNKSGKHSDMVNPFMSFNSAYGLTHGYDINSKLNLNMELAGGENGLYDGDKDYNDSNFKKAAYGFNSGLDYQYSDTLKFGVSSGILHENDALLGSNGENAFSLSGGQTYHFGVNASWEFIKDLTVSGSYYQGYSKAQKFASGLMKTSDLVSSGFAADLNYKVDASANMGFRLSSPLRIEKGSIAVDFANGRAIEDDTVYREQYRASLKPNKREYKFAFYADKDLNESVSLGTELGVRFNPEHSDASNDYRALFGLSWNF